MDPNLIPKPTPELGVFLLLGGVAAITAIGVVAFNNAVRSALCLVVNFFVLAFLYFTLNAQLLGISQIVVYTGAIMVLFLFVIMLLNLGAPQALFEKLDIRKMVAGALGLVMFLLIGSQILIPFLKTTAPRSDPQYGAPESIGRVLFTGYLYPFEIVSVLLLIGIVGSILLAKRKI